MFELKEPDFREESVRFGLVEADGEGFNTQNLQSLLVGDDLGPKIILFASISVSVLILCFLAYIGFNALIYHTPCLKNCIFKSRHLKFLQWFVIKKDTSRRFALGIQPNGPITRAPTMFKINKSFSDSNSISASSSGEVMDQSFSGSSNYST